MAIDPYFLECSVGKLFVIERVPEKPVANVIFVQSFAEEMNKSRHMLTLTATALASQGIAVTIFDHYGTGDSEGDLVDADLELWIKDLLQISVTQYQKYALPQIWIGHRTGAMLALSASGSANPEVLRQLILWNPVLNGKQFINQFFRLRLAGDMVTSGDNKVTKKDIREELAKGSTEIAGYELGCRLVASLEEFTLEEQSFSGLESKSIAWIEVSPKVKPILMPVSNKQIDFIRVRGVSVDAQALSGDQFWATQEITTAPLLIDATLKFVMGKLHE